MRRLDLLNAHLGSVIYNVARMQSGNKDAEVLTIADFLLQWWSDEEKEAASEDQAKSNLEAKIGALLGSIGR